MLITLTNCIITAYVSTGNLDASGSIPVLNSTIATARRELPLGAIVVWKGKKYKMTDHMNKRFNGNNRFDLFFGTNLKRAKEFGIKTNQIVIIVTP